MLNKYREIEINDDETLDEIRGIRIIQKKKGYRFSEDSLILADFPDLSGVMHVADLGTGSGIIAILLAMRSQEIKVTAIELQESLYNMALRNMRLAFLSERVEVVHADIKKLTARFNRGEFDLVISNPPFFKAGHGRLGPDPERTLARHEIAVTMKDIICASEYLLGKGGRVALVYPSGRQNEIISEMNRSGLGVIRSKEVCTKETRIVLVEGMKEDYEGESVEKPPLRL